jgi:LCP family protein required for cell wall assembly
MFWFFRNLFLLIVFGVGVFAAYTLGRNAVNGVNDLISRFNANRTYTQQKVAFPGTATAIGALNVQLSYDKTHAPSPTITPVPPTDVPNVPDMSDQATDVPLVTVTDVPATTVVPTTALTDTTVPSETPAPTETRLPTETFTPTVPSETPIPPTSIPTNTWSAAAPQSALIQNQVPPTNTKHPTFTDVPTEAASATPTASQTPTAAPTQTATLTLTATPSLTATDNIPSTATLPPTAIPPTVALLHLNTPGAQVTAVPSPAPRVKANNNDILNIALLGTDEDYDPTDKYYHTDTILIVSINRTTNTVAMLSIPRDTFVYIPTFGMQRINTAYSYGDVIKFQPGNGFGLLQQVILYNFGIPVHFYAKLSFDGFKAVIDAVKGVDLGVDCQISDLRFQGQYDTKQTPVYSPYTMTPGYYHMDGSLALWYARMRHSTSDFDRNRRQQQVVRAILHSARDQGLLANMSNIPSLWNDLTKVVDTNLNLQDILGLVPIAANIKPTDIRSYYMVKGRELQPWTDPKDASNVQLPVPDIMFKTISDFYTPPSTNRLAQENTTIDIMNGSSVQDMDKVAGDRLVWEGFAATPKGPEGQVAKTTLYDLTGGAKPGAVQTMLRALNLKASQVVSQPDPNRTVDFRLELGADYNSCSAPGFGSSK